MQRWELVFPHRDHVSWQFGSKAFICVSISHITVPMKLILRSTVLSQVLLKSLEVDHGGGVMYGRNGAKPTTPPYQSHRELSHLILAIQA